MKKMRLNEIHFIVQQAIFSNNTTMNNLRLNTSFPPDCANCQLDLKKNRIRYEKSRGQSIRECVQ